MPSISNYKRIPDPTIQPRRPVEVAESNNPVSQPVRIDDTRESTVINQTPLRTGLPVFLWPLLGIVGGLATMAFGIFNAGSFYMTGTRMSGDLATFFYVYQIGSVLEIIGVVIAWESLKKMVSIRN